MAISCEPGTLVELASCFACLSYSQREGIKTYLLAVQAGVEPDADTLGELAKCFTCLNGRQRAAIQTYLLCQIANGTPEDCTFQEGVGSPAGSATPDFVGQLYHQTSDDTYWRSMGLTDADWTLISGGGGGFVWGPDSSILPGWTPGTMVTWMGAGITSVSFPSLMTVTGTFGDLQIYSDELVSIALPLLEEILNVSLDCSQCSALTSLSIPALVNVDGSMLLSDATSLLSFSAPELTTVGGSVMTDGCDVLATISLPVLATVGSDFDVQNCAALTALSLPSLQSVGGYFSADNDAALVSMDLSALITIGITFGAANSTSLVSVLVPAWVPTDGFAINFNNCALDETSVDLILRRCALAGLASASIDLASGTSAAPGAQGQIDKADLITAGCTVATN